MIILTDGKKYGLSYQLLREEYLRLVGLSDEAFLAALPDVIHLACIICYLKEIPSEWCVGDRGIVHELVHLLKGEDATTTTLSDIRSQFAQQLELS